MTRPIWLAFGLLTRLKVPAVAEPTDHEVGAAVGWFPLVGLVVGLAMWAANTAARWYLGPLPAAALAVLAGLAVTGGLHLEGLVDTCDGCLPPLERQRRLDAMDDVHVGAFGVLGAVVLLVVKVCLLADLTGHARAAGLILAPVLGRWAMAHAILQHPAARDDGMGAAFAQKPTIFDWVRATAVASLAAFWLLPMWRAWAVMGIVLGISYLLAAKLSKMLNGLTGDTYGALCELGEVTTLAAIAVAASLPA